MHCSLCIAIVYDYGMILCVFVYSRIRTCTCSVSPELVSDSKSISRTRNNSPVCSCISKKPPSLPVLGVKQISIIRRRIARAQIRAVQSAAFFKVWYLTRAHFFSLSSANIFQQELFGEDSKRDMPCREDQLAMSGLIG